MKRFLSLLAALSILSLSGLLTGCLPTSLNPLGSAENAAPEQRLAGTWYGKSGEDQIFLHFVSGTGAALQIVEVDHEKKGQAHTTLYRAFPSTIEGNRYLNVQDPKQENYYFVRYQISKSGVLTLSLMSDNSVAKAISSGKIKGKVTGSDDNREVNLTDSTEHLAAFVAKSDPDLLFDQKFGTFKRVTLPATETPAEAKPAKKSVPAKKKKKT